MAPPNTTPNAAQGMTFDSAPVQQATTVPGAPSPSASNSDGMTFDANPTSSPITVGASQSASAPGDSSPGLLDRVWETSGAKSMAELGTQVVARPIDLYHQAVEQARSGDWKGASETASKILFSGMLDKDNPISKAAEQLIMQPVQEIAANYKDNRKAGHNPVLSASLLPTAARGTKEMAHNVEGDVGKGNYAGALGDVIAEPTTSHIAGMVPLFGGAIQQVGADLNKDLHDHNYSAVAGDVLGPLLTFGLGKAAGFKAPEEATSPTLAEKIQPEETRIAGERVPVTNKSSEAKLLSNFASREGAKRFIREQVQPAAVKATQSNFTRSGLRAVDQLRDLQGEPKYLPSSTNTMPHPLPQISSVDDLANFLRKEAKSTYAKLDAAAQPEVDAWEKQYGNLEAQEPSKILAPNGKPAIQPQDIPPKPKLFTQLQDQIKNSEDVIDSDYASQADKKEAIENLPKYYQEMSDFLNKHSDVVDHGELGAADNVWKQSRRYDWIANQMRSAVKDVGAGTGELEKTPYLNVNSLERLPSKFDNRFGAGEFNKQLGPQGVRNFDRILNVLQEPKTGSLFTQWLGGLPLKVGNVAKVPMNYVVDNLLFNPNFGSRALDLWEKSKEGAAAARGAAAKVTAAASKAAPVVMSSQKPSAARNVYSSLAGSL